MSLVLFLFVCLFVCSFRYSHTITNSTINVNSRLYGWELKDRVIAWNTDPFTFKRREHTSTFDHLHPKISIHILHTVLYKFPKVLRRRICLTIKSSCTCWSFTLFSWPQCMIKGWYCKEKLVNIWHVSPTVNLNVLIGSYLVELLPYGLFSRKRS